MSSTIQEDFDTEFQNSFPDSDADYQSRVVKESSEQKEVAFCLQNTKLVHNENITARHHFNMNHEIRS